MLVNFTFQNFRSFRDAKTLSLEASSIQDLETSVIRRADYRLLPVVAIYGANSSGKSNVLEALRTMRRVVLNSVKLDPMDRLDFEPFLLRDTPERESSFEIQFIQNKSLYRYGFDYNETRILREWLYETKKRESFLFRRDGNRYEINQLRFKEGNGKEKATPKNRLFLSLVAQLNGAKSQSILEWFRRCNYLSGLSGSDYEGYTVRMFHKELEGCQDARDFFKRMQLGFNDLKISEREFSDEDLTEGAMPDRIRRELVEQLQGKTFLEAQTVHNIYNASGKIIGTRHFPKDRMESDGTKKIIEMAGPIFDSLRDGKVLIIDELDAKLHPIMTRNILQLFMNPCSNPHGAQLIFATHDTNLLDLTYLRRDQIWFTEKDRTSSSDLYSLVEFRSTPSDKHNLARDYINGRYGAIPFLGLMNKKNDETI
ncbi:MAG: ATP-binding protein [Porphyromonadaceae bacterium]|nr:ATP-binding protein [Porphyromonadaceae bacterium]